MYNSDELILPESFTIKLFLFLTIFLTSVSIFLFSKNIYIKNNYIEKEAYLYDTRSYWSGDDYMTSYIYKYIIDNNEYIYETINPREDKITLYCNPNNYSDSIETTELIIFIFLNSLATGFFFAWYKYKGILNDDTNSKNT